MIGPANLIADLIFEGEFKKNPFSLEADIVE